MRVGVGRQDVEPRLVARDEAGEVGVAADRGRLGDDVAHRRAGLPVDALGQGAAVGIRVDRDDPVVTGVGEGHAEERGDRRLAHAALAGEHRDEPGAALEALAGCGRSSSLWARDLGGVAEVDQVQRGFVEEPVEPAVRCRTGRAVEVDEPIGRERLRRLGHLGGGEPVVRHVDHRDVTAGIGAHALTTELRRVGREDGAVRRRVTAVGAAVAARDPE